MNRAQRVDVSFGSDGMTSSGSGSRDMHVSGRNKGIREIDLNFALAEPTGEDGDSSGISEENALLLATVTSLDLSRNEIESLSNLGSLSALRRLDVSYNLISSVQGLPFTLTRLNLSHNRLRHLDGITNLPHLRELNVSANRLSTLMGLGPSTSLQVLRADDNRLVSTVGLEDMAFLRVLSLANNYIEHLDDLVFLSSALSLQTLTLKNNPVARLNGYRLLVAQRQAALLTLDGAPLLRPRQADNYLHTGGAAVHDAKGMGAAASHNHTDRYAHFSKAVTASPPPAPSYVASGLGSMGASARVTPVRVPRMDSHPAGESPLFDDSFLRELCGGGGGGASSSISHGKPAHASSPKATNPAAPIAAKPADPMRGAAAESPPFHPYASSHAAAAPLTTALLDTSAGSQGSPVAEERPPPQPTERGPLLSRAAPQGKARCNSVGHAEGRRTSGSTTPRASAAAAARHPQLDSYARQYEESHAVKRRPVSSCASLTTTATDVSPRRAGSAAVYIAQTQTDMKKEEEGRYVGRHASSGTTMAAADATARLHDCLVAKEQLEKENGQLRGRLRKAEEQLAESRRIVSEQLGDLSRTRLERDALRQSEGDVKERLERARRHVKTLETHHKEEIETLHAQFERTKTFYEAQVADLRRQLAAEGARAVARGRRSHGNVCGGGNAGAGDSLMATAAVSPGTEASPQGMGAMSDAVAAAGAAIATRTSSGIPPPSLTTSALNTSAGLRPPTAMALPPFPQTPLPALGSATAPPVDTSPEADTPASTPRVPVNSLVLAAQLKGWLYSEMAGDLNVAEQDALFTQLQQSLLADESQDPQAAVSPTADRAREVLEAYVLGQQQRQQQQRSQDPMAESATGGMPLRSPRPTVPEALPGNATASAEGVSLRRNTLSPLRE